MTGTPCRNAALDSIIATWAAAIAAFLGAIVEAILTMAENIRIPLLVFGAGRREAGRRLPARSRSMASKLGFLPLSASPPHAFARERSPDPRGKSEARIKALFAGPSRPPKTSWSFRMP